jgi:PAS domain S-box-containing protein
MKRVIVTRHRRPMTSLGKNQARQEKPNISADAAEVRRRAEVRLRERQGRHKSQALDQTPTADTQRVLHELQVHQIELEMQNAELQEARNRMEVLLEKYTDLYDFAPTGYFSLDEKGVILEVNLTGAALLGVERFRLIRRRFQRFVTPASQPVFLAFLEKVFGGRGREFCEAPLLHENGTVMWADLRAVSAVSPGGAWKWCRLAVSDVTALKQAEHAQRRMNALAAANRELEQEIVRRQKVEDALTRSEEHQRQLLDQSRHMQDQLRHLSHQILQAQEEERKRISRELHDEIAQTLMGINVHLENLAREAVANPQGLKQKIVRTQRLVEKSVNIVHRFARELRPMVLDDLGLIPALHSHMKEFTKRTGIRVHFTAFTSAKIRQLDNAESTALYRVALEALANVAQHAQASRVKVSIQKLPYTVCMEINDDGKAFDVEGVLLARGRRRLGLLGMRERVEMVGGSFHIESSPGHGTTLRAEIPFSHTGERAKARWAQGQQETAAPVPQRSRSRRRVGRPPTAAPTPVNPRG